MTSERWNPPRGAVRLREAVMTHDLHPDCHCPKAVHRHGSRTTYIVHGCRCDACREDNTVKARERRRAQLYGRHQLVDAEPARTHIRSLMDQGMGWKRIARAAGLNPSTVYPILYGKHADNPDHPEHRPPRKQILRSNADAILAVKLDLADAAFIPAIGTVRRIQALHAAGWTLSELAGRLGMSPTNFTRLHTDRKRRPRKRMPRRGVQAINRYRLHWTVQRVTADAVARLYDQLVDLDAAEHMTPIGYARSVASAKRRGWAPPAAWDADSIDDPAARPMPTDPESVRLREQVRAYRMRRAA